MIKTTGNILKMRTTLSDVVGYKLPIGDKIIEMNPLIGKDISLKFTGRVHDILSGDKIKKSFGQGYSYKNFIGLARCDLCILSPERCHFDKGTCREPDWGDKNCMVPHIIYLANTGQAKIGITRETQVPTRFMDQGASYALPILRVENRKESGIIETEIKSMLSDKTNWRKMLQKEPEEIDLKALREEVFDQFGGLLDSMGSEDLESEVIRIRYPVLEYPEKLKSLSFDKEAELGGRLMGIKGQYLIFDTGVLNMRKFQGYELEFSHSAPLDNTL